MRKIRGAVRTTVIVEKRKYEKKYGIFAFGKTNELYGWYDDSIVSGFCNNMVHIYTLEEAKEKLKEILSHKKYVVDKRIDYNKIYIYKISGSHLSTVLKETGSYYKMEWKEREKIATLIERGLSDKEIQQIYLNAPSRLSILNNVRFKKTKSSNIFDNDGYIF